MTTFSGLCLVFVSVIALSESTYMNPHYAKKMMFGKKGFGPSSGPMFRGTGGMRKYPSFRKIHVPHKVVKKIPVVKEVRVFRKVPVYRKVYIDRPVYTPVYRDVPQHNPGAWMPKEAPIALQAPATRVERQPGPNANIDIRTEFVGPDMGMGMDMGIGMDMGAGMGMDFAPDFGFVDPLPPQPVGETIVTSNIQITDADHVISNTNSASSQSQTSNFNLNANIHDADTVSIGGPIVGAGVVGASAEANLLNGLDGLGGLVDVAMLGGGAAAALDMGALAGAQQGGLGPMDHGHGHGFLGGFGPAPADQVATAAVHDGQAGMMVGEPVAIVSLDGHLGGQGHVSQSAGHMAADVGMTSAGGHAGHI